MLQGQRQRCAGTFPAAGSNTGWLAQWSSSLQMRRLVPSQTRAVRRGSACLILVRRRSVTAIAHRPWSPMCGCRNHMSTTLELEVTDCSHAWPKPFLAPIGGQRDLARMQSHAQESAAAAASTCTSVGRSQFSWPQPGLPRIPADEHLFLVSPPEAGGPPPPVFCLGVLRVASVSCRDNAHAINGKL